MSEHISFTPEPQYPSIQTSLIEVTDKLPVQPPCRIFFKNEYEQPSGSFKLRGIGNLVGKSVNQAIKSFPNKKIHCFASSGGNAGLAVAYLARYYNVACTVVLPTIAKPEIIQKLHEYGAETVMYGDSIYEADKYVKLLIEQTDANKIHTIYCHPFDNPLIWQGHSKLVDEIFQSQLTTSDGARVRGVVASVGGGGLHCGIASGLKNNKKNADVLLVETKQAPTFTESIKAGEVVTLKSVKSLATSLACSYVTPQSLEFFNDQTTNKTYVETIDDFDAVKGSLEFHRNFGIAVEPACGAALSVVYDQMNLIKKNFKGLQKDDIIIVVVCGGSCTNEAGIEDFKALLRQQVKL